MAEKKKPHIEDKYTDPFAEYFISGEPGRADKVYVWQTAIGLQDVDRLQPSEYLLNTARDNIEGNISIEEARLRIDSYYEEKKHDQGDRKEEADKELLFTGWGNKLNNYGKHCGLNVWTTVLFTYSGKI